MASPMPLHFFMQRYTAACEAEMRAFVDCIARDREPPVDGADGRKAIVLGLAALRSAREHRPVAVAEVERR